MHKRIADLVEEQIERNPIETEVIEDDFLELLGISKSNGILDMLTRVGNFAKDRKTEDPETQALLVQLGWLMDRKNLGLARIIDADEKYRVLKKELDKWLPKVRDSELHSAIANYVLSSYGMNSLFLFVGSLAKQQPHIAELLPALFRSYIEGFSQSMDMYMGRLLVEVAKGM